MLAFKLMVADFKRYFTLFFVMIFLISATLTLSLTTVLQERALRLGSAAAADKFDIIIGAKGGSSELVLSSVFLRPAMLDLVSGDLLEKLQNDERVAWISPIGMGDYYNKMPIVGIWDDMIKDDIKDGRIFNKDFEAVAGSDTGLNIGDTFTPVHGEFETHGDHSHAHIKYTVVGIKKSDNTIWDKAILVPISSVWTIHDHNHEANHHHSHKDGENLDRLDDHHANKTHDEIHSDGEFRSHIDKALHSDDDHLEHNHSHDGANHHSDHHMDEHYADHDEAHHHPDELHHHANEYGDTPAIVVKPKSIAAAYQIRQEYTNDESIAVFPGEILVQIYSILGDVKSWLLAISMGLQGLIVLMVLAIAFVFISQKKDQIAEFRIFGADTKKVMLFVWSELVVIVLIGMILGVILGYALANFISIKLGSELGFGLIVKFEVVDFYFLALVFVSSIILSLIPLYKIYKISVASSLRG